MKEALNELYNYIYDVTGLTFPETNRVAMDQRVCRLFADVNENKILSFIKSDENAMQKLLDLLTVNESYFFREMNVINAMVQRIMKTSGKVRILCAPSSSGEESFSIVITLLKAGKPASEIEIIGIDINSHVIKLAQEALYTKRRVHRVSNEDLNRYFRPKGDAFSLNDDVRSCVTFKNLNIFDESISQLGNFDIVFSRNMLIYFDNESSLRAEKVFYDLLKPQGHLLVGHADFISNEVGFNVELCSGHYCYQK